MKIAILVSGLPPLHNGGTEIATVELAKCASKKHEVHIIAGTTQDGEYKINGLNIHTVRAIKGSYLYGALLVPGVVKAIKKIKPDVIHAQGIQMALSAFVASKITKIPYILYGRGEIYMKWVGKSFLSKILMNGADRVIAQTVDMAEEMGYYTYKHVEVIPNGIDAERFQLDRVKSSWLKVAVAVGRARPEKNLACFVDAMKYLEKELKFDHAMGVIIGDGEQIPELKKRAEGTNIRFMGAVDNSGIPMILKSADVLVNTSLSEGFPMAVLEGMACFPSDTHVIAKDIVKKHQRVHSGSIIEINVAGRTIQATPKHPFWTNYGWVEAAYLNKNYLLLYNNDYEERLHSVYRGRIGDIEETLYTDEQEGDCECNAEAIPINNLQISYVRAKEEHRRSCGIEVPQINRDTISLYSRNNRRGRNSYNEKNAFSEVETDGNDSQYIASINGMVRPYSGYSVLHMDRKKRGEYRIKERQVFETIYVSNIRYRVATILQNAVALHDNKEETFGIGNRVVGNPFITEQNRGTNEEAREYNKGYTCSEFQRIEDVTVHEVRLLPVFNLTTLSSTYLVNGYLVHNCGLPVVAPRINGIPEIITEMSNGLLFQPNDYKGCALAIHQIFTKSDMAKFFSRNNLAKVKQYSWDNVVEMLYR